MEWGINDSLKSRAYGQKKEADLETMNEKVQNYQSQGGQYYPTDRDGKFDEWGAMVKHMTQRHQLLEKEKHEKLRKQQIEYSQFLDQQRMEKMQQKLQDKSQKQHEYEYMVEKNKILKQLNDQKALEDKGYHDYINDQYAKKIEETEVKKKFDREIEIEEERNRQERVKRDLEIEKQRLIERRDKLKMEMDLTLKYKTVMTEAEKSNLDRQRQEWQQLCEITAKKEIDREQNYKKFFKDFENDMQRRQNQHIDHVLQTEVQKQQKLDQIEQSNSQKYMEWQEQKEKFEKDIRTSGLRDMLETNKHKIEERQNKINQDKNDMKNTIQERQHDEQDYRQYEKMLKDQDRDRRKIYKDTLDHQMKLLDLQKVKYGTMTNEEKRMNRGDLQHYKTNEVNQFEAMIPGIHNLNTVGTSPLKRGARQIIGTNRASMADLLSGNTKEMSQTMTNGLSASASVKILPPYQTQSPMTNEMKIRIAEQKENGGNPDRYNPITNPLPWVNQNPYINKEKTIAKSTRATSLLV